LPARGAVFGASRRDVEIDDARNFFELQVQIMPRHVENRPIGVTKRNKATACNHRNPKLSHFKKIGILKLSFSSKFL
jgi:hypothetical protein